MFEVIALIIRAIAGIFASVNGNRAPQKWDTYDEIKRKE